MLYKPTYETVNERFLKFTHHYQENYYLQILNYQGKGHIYSPILLEEIISNPTSVSVQPFDNRVNYKYDNQCGEQYKVVVSSSWLNKKECHGIVTAYKTNIKAF